MYSGHGKSDGGLVGYVIKDGIPVSLDDAQQEASVDEILVCINEKQEIIHLQASLNEDGNITWNRIDEKVSILRTVSMSQMTSMLKDNHRNEMYSYAILKCIENFHSKYNRKPTCIDIGSGTGLLSMLW